MSILLCRRLPTKPYHQEAKNHLEALVELLEDAPAVGGGKRTSFRGSVSCASESAHRDPDLLAVALGNLGVVCGEQGDCERASELLEASLQNALSSANLCPRCEHSGAWVSNMLI